jgi:hypothetical protein
MVNKGLNYGLMVFAAALAASLAAGFLAKASEVKRFPPRARIVFGLACGFLLALAASLSVETAVLFYGIAVGVLIAGKIDVPAHYAALAGGLAGVLAFGFPLARGQLVLVAGVALVAFFDEKAHDFVTKKLKRGRKINVLLKLFEFVARNRLFLEIFAVAFAVLAGALLFLAALLAFDAGYAVAVRLQKR